MRKLVKILVDGNIEAGASAEDGIVVSEEGDSVSGIVIAKP